MSAQNPDVSQTRFVIGITGHRRTTSGGDADASRIEDAIGNILATIEDRLGSAVAQVKNIALGPPRLCTLLAHGVDQMAANAAAKRGWEVVAQLPFGQRVNIAVNAQPQTVADAVALLAGEAAADPEVQARAARIRYWSETICAFELADRDAAVSAFLLAALEDPDDQERKQRFDIAASAQAALAGRVLIEQSDLLIGVWNGHTRDNVGGTGHTIAAALELSCPVLLIDPVHPEKWTIVTLLEELAGWQERLGDDIDRLDGVIRNAIGPKNGAGTTRLYGEYWRAHSSHFLTFYRRIEAMFSGEGRPFRSLKQVYETREEISNGSAATLFATARAMPGANQRFVTAMAEEILPAFAWADGISAWLSDAYRSGMIANFILSALAIIIGVLYLPLAQNDKKWIFAAIELLLLASILMITWLGGLKRFHARWFETRRVAEYLRHSPVMLLIGVARPAGRWPQGEVATWPEYAARHALRALGLPQMAVTTGYLKAALSSLLLPHVTGQRGYHEVKAKRLKTIHHRLDHLAETLFKLAVVSVSCYLLLKLGAYIQLLPHGWPDKLSKLFTFLGVAFPTLAASITGMRYFGDFERFGAISEVTAGKLELVEQRITQLLAGPDAAIDYASVSKVAHDIDDIVVSEIESWQAVFSGKHIALPA